MKQLIFHILSSAFPTHQCTAINDHPRACTIFLLSFDTVSVRMSECDIKRNRSVWRIPSHCCHFSGHFVFYRHCDCSIVLANGNRICNNSSTRCPGTTYQISVVLTAHNNSSIVSIVLSHSLLFDGFRCDMDTGHLYPVKRWQSPLSVSFAFEIRKSMRKNGTDKARLSMRINLYLRMDGKRNATMYSQNFVCVRCSMMVLKDDQIRCQICRHFFQENVALALAPAKLSIYSVIIYLIAVWPRMRARPHWRSISIQFFIHVLSARLQSTSSTNSNSKISQEKNGHMRQWVENIPECADWNLSLKMKWEIIRLTRPFKGTECRVTPWDKWFRYANESFDLWLYLKQLLAVVFD